MTAREDKSHGYDQVAERVMEARDGRIGVATVRAWSRALPRGAAVLDLGCGHGVPIAQALIDDGFDVYGVDASPRMIAAFRRRFPHAPAECAPAEESNLFNRSFDGAIAWGLLFLLPADLQETVIRKAAMALKPGGRLLFTAPSQEATWADAQTGRTSLSLGAEGYQRLLEAAGLTPTGEDVDEGENHYYFALKA